MSILSSREFWQQVYIAAVRAGNGYDVAKVIADEAVEAYVARINRGEL